MRSFVIATHLFLSSLPHALGQYLFHHNVPGCQIPALSESTFILFSNPTNPEDASLQYSIATPWRRFYPDALRADLAKGGFQIMNSLPANSSKCGWKLATTVKKNGWRREDIRFRHVTGRAAKEKTETTDVLPLLMSISFIEDTARATPQKLTEDQPNNATLARIRSILETNSPQADVIFMMLEISLPILGVIIFITLLLLGARYLTNKMYPGIAEHAERARDIALECFISDETLTEETSRPDRLRKTSSKFYIKPALARISSSIYSRSLDGVTLSPKGVVGRRD